MAPRSRPALRFTLPSLAADWGNAAVCTRLLVAWLAVRTVLWTVAIVASHHNPPLDLVEWLSWGGRWQWGYAKHPPLPAWVADSFARLSPGDVWGVYLAGYLVAAGTILAAYRLGREYLSPPLALFAALALDGLLFLTNDPAEFGNNVMLGLGWAWLAVCFHRALETGRLRWWVAVGVVTGLTVLCKYTVGVLLLCVAAFVLYDRSARRCLRTPGPYLAAAVAAVVVAPHLWWLVQNDFITFRYAAERSADARGVAARALNPLQFVGSQFVRLVPLAVILWPLFRNLTPQPPSLRGKGEPESVPEAPLRFGEGVGRGSIPFLHFVVLGPVVFLLVLSLATGCQLREIWGSPLWTFAGVWALVVFGGAAEPALWRAAARRWAVVAAAVIGFTVVKQEVNPHLFKVGGRTAFPGKELAAEVNRRWAERFGGAPPIVGGEGWRAGLVCAYSVHRPLLYSSGAMDYLVMQPDHSVWTGDADLNARGGVILWDADQFADPTAFLAPRFPRVELQPPIELPYRTSAPVAPTRVGVAFVPPTSSPVSP